MTTFATSPRKLCVLCGGGTYISFNSSVVHWLGSSGGQCMLKTQILNLSSLQFWFSRSGTLDFSLAPAMSLIQVG